MNRQSFCKLAIGLGTVNYLVYAAATLFAGGDVLHGHVAQGHYFAAAGSSFVEVAPSLFSFCRWHPYTLLVTFPLLLWGGFHLVPEPRSSDELVFRKETEDARLSTYAPCRNRDKSAVARFFDASVLPVDTSR